jgi:hypothetical protein
VHYGIAGNANPSLNIGDVTIPQYWAHTGLWVWQVLKYYNFTSEFRFMSSRIELFASKLCITVVYKFLSQLLILHKANMIIGCEINAKKCNVCKNIQSFFLSHTIGITITFSKKEKRKKKKQDITFTNLAVYMDVHTL